MEVAAADALRIMWEPPARTVDLSCNIGHAEALCSDFPWQSEDDTVEDFGDDIDEIPQRDPKNERQRNYARESGKRCKRM